LTIAGTLMFRGFGFFTSILTISTLIGFITLLINRKIGLNLMLVISTLWLLRYFEHASFLLLYDPNSLGRWMLIIIPIILAFIIFGMTFKEFLKRNNKQFRLEFWLISFIGFLSIGLFSFIYKPHTDEFNCWYYFDNNTENYKIRFAVSPNNIFETTSNSAELKRVVQADGMTYETRKGYYCPETNVRIITQFKKIIGIKIIGFRNTEINKLVRFENAIEIDINTLTGDKTIMQPEFNLGD
jgi:hypothetical protein